MQRISLPLPVMARVSNAVDFMKNTPLVERELVTKLLTSGDFRITSVTPQGQFMTNVTGTMCHSLIAIRPEEVKYLTLWSAAC